ncbi:hypothetical protein CONCODRAFT_13575, partial [Conidiobolus coronatus NRRL 28638]
MDEFNDKGYIFDKFNNNNNVSSSITDNATTSNNENNTESNDNLEKVETKENVTDDK